MNEQLWARTEEMWDRRGTLRFDEVDEVLREAGFERLPDRDGFARYLHRPGGPLAMLQSRDRVSAADSAEALEAIQVVLADER
jgi:hypothetical protein